MTAALEEDALRDVDAREGIRIGLAKLAAESYEARGVVIMKVAENHVLHVTEVEF